MKDIKNFIKPSLLITIIVGTIIVSIGGNLGIKKYQDYQTEKLLEKERSRELIADQQNTLEKTQQALEETKLEIKKLEALKLKKEKGELLQKPTQNISEDFSFITKQWRPSVAFIDCMISSNEDVLFRQTGSGVFYGVGKNDDSVSIITNGHVINFYGRQPTSCNIKFPNDPETVTIDNTGNDVSFLTNDGVIDYGIIIVRNPTAYMKKVLTSQQLGVLGNECSNKATLGDKILILGYPGIGSRNDITVTEGIISGYEGAYYITSAKVEHGNSGGAAISVEDNCYLGIPTYVEAGDIETLARILNIKSI